jgi:tetratricopeptide (TPR) repeat protein
MGDHEHVITTARRELGAAPAMAAWGFGLVLVTNLRVGQAYHSLGEYSRAMDSLRKNLDMLQGGQADDHTYMIGLPSVLTGTWLALCLAERGEFHEGLAAAETALRRAEVGDPGYSLVVASGGLGSACLLKGDLTRAVTVLERGLPREPAEPVTRVWPFIASALGAAYTGLGRVDEALPLLEQAVERARAMKLKANQALRLARLAEAHFRAGRPDGAFPLAAQGLDLAQEHRERGHEAHALRLLASIEIERAVPNLDRAEESYQKALALANPLGMRPLQAHCHVGLGRLYRRRGDSEAAAAAVSGAREH